MPRFQVKAMIFVAVAVMLSSIAYLWRLQDKSTEIPIHALPGEAETTPKVTESARRSNGVERREQPAPLQRRTRTLIALDQTGIRVSGASVVAKPVSERVLESPELLGVTNEAGELLIDKEEVRTITVSKPGYRSAPLNLKSNEPELGAVLMKTRDVEIRCVDQDSNGVSEVTVSVSAIIDPREKDSEGGKTRTKQQPRFDHEFHREIARTNSLGSVVMTLLDGFEYILEIQSNFHINTNYLPAQDLINSGSPIVVVELAEPFVAVISNRPFVSIQSTYSLSDTEYWVGGGVDLQLESIRRRLNDAHYPAIVMMVVPKKRDTTLRVKSGSKVLWSNGDLIHYSINFIPLFLLESARETATPISTSRFELQRIATRVVDSTGSEIDAARLILYPKDKKLKNIVLGSKSGKSSEISIPVGEYDLRIAYPFNLFHEGKSTFECDGAIQNLEVKLAQPMRKITVKAKYCDQSVDTFIVSARLSDGTSWFVRSESETATLWIPSVSETSIVVRWRHLESPDIAVSGSTTEENSTLMMNLNE